MVKSILNIPICQQVDFEPCEKVLIVGGAPSIYKKLNLLKKFNGVKIFTDIVSSTLIEDNYIPDYIVTLEYHEGQEVGFFPKWFNKYNFKVIHNWMGSEILKTHLDECGIKRQPFQSYRWERINNVGLFGVRFAREILQAKEIYLIGFDHWGGEYLAQVSKDCVTCFNYFLEDEATHCKVINCSASGILYGPNIIDGSDITDINSHRP